MKKLALLSFLPLVTLLFAGCHDRKQNVEVYWTNSLSNAIEATIYMPTATWSFTLESGESALICSMEYASSDDLENHGSPFAEYWACDLGKIDSVIFADKVTGEKSVTCGTAYKPLKYEDYYDAYHTSGCNIDYTTYTFEITPKRFATMRGLCPCDAEDPAIRLDSVTGMLHYYKIYSVWYFENSDGEQKRYMLQNLPEEYRWNDQKARITGTGHNVDFPEPYNNYFTGGCLADYTVELLK